MDVLSAIFAKLGLLGIGVAAVITIIFLVFGTVILWALGLIVGVAFAVIGLMFLFAFHKMGVLDVERNRWLLFVPFIMFALGFGADKVGILSIQPLALTDSTTPASIVTWILLIVIICLLIVDVVASRE